jgi:hypothetical protein
MKMKRLLNKVSKNFLPGISNRVLLRFRWVGSAMLILSHFVIVYFSIPVGVSIMLASDTICLPYAIRKGYWDIVAVITLYTIINISRLLTL